MQPDLADLRDALDRFGGYGPRSRRPRPRCEAGDIDWFTKPLIDSYHTVWFELHEDLLATLGIERARRSRGHDGHESVAVRSVLTAMVTPVRRRRRARPRRCRRAGRWLVDQGNDGLVVTGTTGEAPVLTDDEQVDLWRAVREAVDVPLVAGTGTNDTAPLVELTERGRGVGVDGILAVTPYYNRPSQAGLEAHFRAVAGGHRRCR